MLEVYVQKFLAGSQTDQRSIAEHVLAGRCKDFTEYKHAVGKLKAFDDSDNRARKLFKEFIDHVDIE